MHVIEADITSLAVDAIVNATNEALLGGGDGDGTIHRAAGPALLEECRHIGGCPTSAARITGGYDLPARHVIHTVGPISQGGGEGEADFLAACYRNALVLAGENKIQSIAFPAISTGVYGYPADAAARIAVNTVSEYLQIADGEARVTLCCFGPASAEHHRAAITARLG